MARIGRPQERELVLVENASDELERITHSRSAAHGLVRRAGIILANLFSAVVIMAITTTAVTPVLVGRIYSRI